MNLGLVGSSFTHNVSLDSQFSQLRLHVDVFTLLILAQYQTGGITRSPSHRLPL